MTKKIVAVEIGGTKQQIAVGNANGEIEFSTNIKLGEMTKPENILAWIKQEIGKLKNTYDFDLISVGYGGPINLHNGTVITSMQVDGWNNFPLRNWFESTFEKDVILLNDTDAAGLGEYVCGNGQKCRNFFYTNIGTGIGGALILNGQLFQANGRGAGEIGHSYVINPITNSLVELEQFCSGLSIEKRLNEPGYVPTYSKVYNKNKKRCEDLAYAFQNNDDFAIQEVDLIANVFAQALANVISIVAPDNIVIGGGIANFGDSFIDRIFNYTKSFCYYPFVDTFEINKSKLLQDAVLVGCLIAGRMY